MSAHMHNKPVDLHETLPEAQQTPESALAAAAGSPLYWQTLRDNAAVQILAALVASPERYRYIAEKVATGKLTNHEATAKNIHKARVMADQLVADLKANA